MCLVSDRVFAGLKVVFFFVGFSSCVAIVLIGFVLLYSRRQKRGNEGHDAYMGAIDKALGPGV